MDRIAIGVVGCGGMGQRHLRAYAGLNDVGIERFEVAAICDPRSGVAADAADLAEELLGTRPLTFSSHEELIGSGIVEAVDIVTDPSAHHLVAVPALEAGLHVTCEKPLGITVRACREIIDAVESGVVLSTAENYRRDAPNRLARRVLDCGLLGQVHALVEMNIGGSDRVLISPWRHILESGPMALDMGVHYLDMFNYLVGELRTAYGRSWVAEPFRRVEPGMATSDDIEYVDAGVMRATGDDSLAAVFGAASGVVVQLTYIPSGPGHSYRQRTVHGRAGSMSVPRDRTGDPVTVYLGDTTVSGPALRELVGGFRLDGTAAAFFGADGTEYERPFSYVDAAILGIELDDFGVAVREGKAPEVGGEGGLAAVAGVWAIAESQRLGRAVTIAEVASGETRVAQAPVDRALGLGQ